jgi:uncharacterized protein (TIGR00730 family)
MNITVFGGAAPRPGEPAYEEAVQLGRLLALAGHTVLTGGYSGTMEAVSRGAAEAGGHVIGVTCEEIERWRPTSANAWVKEEWRMPTLTERLLVLMDRSQAALALPGGAGTLVEISLLWNRMLINAVPARPLILIGPAWRRVFDDMFSLQSSYLSSHDTAALSFASSIAEAAVLLDGGKKE